MERFRTVAKGLMAAIQANAAYVTTARNKLECSPKDTTTLASFLASEAEKQQVQPQSPLSDGHASHSKTAAAQQASMLTLFKNLHPKSVVSCIIELRRGHFKLWRAAARPSPLRLAGRQQKCMQCRRP